MPFRDDAYDILLDNQGYMLARQNQLNQGGRSWSVESAGYSTTQQTANERRYGTAPATIESAMVWRTLHLGYGEERQRVEGMYNYSENVDARFYEAVIPGPKVTKLTVNNYTSAVRGFEEFDGVLWVNSGRYINKILPTNLITSKDLEDFAVGQFCYDMTVFDGKLIVACGDSGHLVTRDDTATWEEATDVYAKFLTVWQDALYATLADEDGNYSGHEVAMLSSGSDAKSWANWSGLNKIGDETSEITSLAALHSLVFVGKEDGLHGLDSSWISPPLTPEMRSYRSAYNCEDMIAWHGQVWVPHLRGLLAYTDMGDSGFSLRSVGPGRNVSDDNPVRGRVTALAGDDNWLYASVYNGTDSYILAGKPIESDGMGMMVWHPIVHLADTFCNALHISGLWSSPRLFFGMDQNVGYIVLPRNSDNPLQDDNCRYATGGTIYYSAHSWNAPNTTKLWKSIEIQADNLSLMQYITVSYRVDKGAWVKAGTAKVSPSVSIGLTSGAVSGNEIEVKLEFTQQTDYVPIIVRAVIIRGLERPSTTDVITAIVRCANNLPLRTGGTCPRSGATILAELKAMAERDNTMTLVDLIGARREVVVVPPVRERVEYDQQGDMPRETLAEITMAVVEFDESRFTEVVLFAGGSDHALLIPLMVPVMLGGSEVEESKTFTSLITSRPRITIVGPINNCVITNQITGKKLDLTGTPLGPLTVISIDMHTSAPTVTDQSGADCRAYLTEDSNLNSFAVIAGSNTITVTGTGATSATKVYLEY